MNQLRPTLSERHVNMMCFSQSLGIGLFLQNGRAIYYAGPALATVAYFLSGTIIWSAAASLGEMTALFPVKGPIYELPKRFLDESVGYATAWLTWFNWIILICAEVVAITHIFQFRYPPDLLHAAGYPDSTLQYAPSIAPSVIIISFLPVILLVNLLPVRHFGQIEYLCGCIKLAFLVMLIVFNVVVHAMQPAHHKHFWTYNSPYGATSQNITLADGHTVLTGAGGRLAGMWEAMTTAVFGLIGTETVAITAAENKDLRTEETIKIATRKISLRLIVLYTLATFTVGLNVPYTYPTISDDHVISFGFGQNSAFVASAVLNRIPVLPLFINDFIIFTALSAGINGCYNASRTLHSLACDPNAWPNWGPVQSFRRRLEKTSYGVPYVAVFVSWTFGWISFLGSNNNSAIVLGRMVRCVTIAILIVYAVICVSYLEFYKCIKQAAEGKDEAVDDKDDPEIRSQYDRDSPTYPYKSHGQWLRACYALLGCFLLTFFNGWRSLTNPISAADFLGCYISILIFAVFVILYQIKLNGWNPLNWRRRASRELQNPRPLVVANEKRRGRLNLENTDNLLTTGNLTAFARWIWVWLK